MPRDPLLILRIPPTLRESIDADAATRGTTRSEAVRGLLLAHYTTPTRDAPRPAKPRERPAGNAKSGVCEHRTRAGAFCRRCDRLIP